jgi:hypothetical protein
MPTFRSRDGNRKDIEQNNTSFGIAAQVLKEGGTLAIFPEEAIRPDIFYLHSKKDFPELPLKLKNLPILI